MQSSNSIFGCELELYYEFTVCSIHFSDNPNFTPSVKRKLTSYITTLSLLSVDQFSAWNSETFAYS